MPELFEEPAAAGSPLVTVAILCHDAAAYLERTLHALRRQSYPNLEIVVLDNGSTDATPRMLDAWPGIRTIRQDHVSGYGHAKNALIERSAGEYVLLLDDDVALDDPGAVRGLLAVSRRLRDRCLLSLALEDDRDGATWHYGLFFTPTKRGVPFAELRRLRPFRVAAPVGGCVFGRRRLFHELGGFDPIYPVNHDDYDLGARAGLQGIGVWVVPAIAAVHQGATRRTPTARWEWSYSYYLCGMMRTLAKACRIRSAVVWIPAASIWILWRGLTGVRIHGVGPFVRALLRSIGRMAADAPSTLAARRAIQLRRTVHDDGFLRMLPPPGCRNLLGRALAVLLVQPTPSTEADPFLRPLPHN
jgi:GT2 family glycosyltransferase